MHFLEYFYNNNFKYDLINKFYYANIKKIPTITKIILNFKCNNNDLKNLSSTMLAIEIITNQKGTLTKSKHSIVYLKIRKGNPTGCKVILKKKLLINFLTNQLIEILPKTKNFNVKNNKQMVKKTNTFSYKIKNNFYFSKLENHYYLFNSLPTLNITIVTNTNNKNEILFILKTFKIQFII